jgi:hypothetical protein
MIIKWIDLALSRRKQEFDSPRERQQIFLKYLAFSFIRSDSVSEIVRFVVEFVAFQNQNNL